MGEPITEIYDALAAGKGEELDLEGQRRNLFYACLERAGDEAVDVRLGALRVAAHLTTDDRMRLVEVLVSDAEPKVRRYAFNLAVEAHSQGISALKTAVVGPDLELAVEALGMLITQSNRTDGLHARQWLDAADPRIRAGAAMLLGNISGPSQAVPLRRMAEKDPDAAVREVAALAARRAMGEVPKLPAHDFWEAGPTPIPVSAAAAPVSAAPAAPAPVSAPAAPAPAAPPAVPAPAPPQATENAVVPSANGQEQVRDEPRDWRVPSALPANLPGEMRALVKLLGMVGAADRGALVPALEAGDVAARNTLLRGWRPGGDPALGRGVALAIGLLDLKTHAVQLRGFLTDVDAGVRAGAAEGVGMVGAPSLIPPLEGLLSDGDRDVRLAAIEGMKNLLVRADRHDLLRDKLGKLCSDPDEGIKAAATEALAGLA